MVRWHPRQFRTSQPPERRPTNPSLPARCRRCAVRREQPVSPTTGAPLTPEVRNATIAAAQKHLRKRGLTDINVDVVPRLTDISPTARSTDAALWRSRERLIALQVDALDDAAHYLDHEAIHAIDDSGYWRGTERQTLLQAALDTPAVRERVDAAYDDLKKAADPYRYESELLAELYTAHRANPNLFAPEVRSILDRLVEFLKALGGAVRETTPAEVLRRIDNGEVGRRSRQQADAAARVYHGSGQRGLTTLRADIPLEERNYPNAASTLGVFTTPNENVARSYQGATGGPVVLNPKTGKYQRGALYTADVDLKRPVMMDKASFYGQFVDSDPAAIARAAEFKRDAIARGHDGVYVYDERTGNHEIVTFADLPVEEMDAFARREQSRDLAIRSEHHMSLADIVEPSTLEAPDVPEASAAETFDPRLPDRVPPELRSFRPVDELRHTPTGESWHDYIRDGRRIKRGEGWAPLNDMGVEQAQGLLNDLWDKAWSDTGITPERRAAFEATTGILPPTAEYVDAALHLKEDARFWYELGGEGFHAHFDFDPASAPPRSRPDWEPSDSTASAT